MDIVFINNLTVNARIGVYEWEKIIYQPLIIDIEIAWDNRPSGLSDKLELALDYSAVVEAIEHFTDAHSFELIEAFAESLTSNLINLFNITRIKLKLTKPTAIKNASVGIIIERGQN